MDRNSVILEDKSSTTIKTNSHQPSKFMNKQQSLSSHKSLVSHTGQNQTRTKNKSVPGIANEITFRERRKIRSINSKYTRKLGETLNMSSNSHDNNQHITYSIRSSQDIVNKKQIKNNIDNKGEYYNRLVKKLMRQSPHSNIPKKVKFSVIAGLDITALPVLNLRTHCLTKGGNQFKHVLCGSSTIYYNKNREKEHLFKKLLLNSGEFTTTFKRSIKWKNLRWIITRKGNLVDPLINCYKTMKWFIDGRQGKFSKHIFEEFIRLVGLKRDKEFIENVFLIYDVNRDDSIDFKEMIAGFILFREDSYYNKINLLMNICEEGNNNVILEEFIKLLKLYIFNKKDAKRLHDLIKYGLSKIIVKDEVINKKILLQVIKSNDEINQIIIRNMENFAEVENMFEEEVSNISKANLKKSK